ncbi:MAG: putative Co/Zn/Cd efflux system rane fusion protein [Acidobacteriaceae bacterium]|nr:putative Co/Zn/Cd efflux system rane fusion protein [Acidobacteriaceae bacterium]
MTLSSIRVIFFSLACLSFLAGCDGKKKDEAAEAPPKASVEKAGDINLVQVKHAERFGLTTVTERKAGSTLNVTGAVFPDVSRTIPVISLANGRVVDTFVRLGDTVKKGQLLMEVQSTDVSGAFAVYLKASNDERLARVQYDRAKLLFDKGAISKAQMETAENGELDAKTDLNAAEMQLKVLGVDKANPSAAVKVYAPASGVIISQNVTSAGAAGVALSGSSTAFTIADLSHIWIVCDVFEGDLSTVRLGQTAEIRLTAYPDKVLNGTVSDIGAVLDPTTRTAKVRIQVDNSARTMRVGMFATATLHGQKAETRMVVPASAVLHLQDRDWVYVPLGNGQFRRTEVHAGVMVDGGGQEIVSGLGAGQQVIAKALDLQNSAAQE